jgi:sRNA-binding carbon storage regulator CsrA
MLILSRGLNEAVVLADRVIVTLVRLLSGRAELAIQSSVGGPSALVELGLGESTDLGLSARVSLVEVREAADCNESCCGGPKARLGFDVPPSVRMSRKELWVAGSHGPDWYFPKAATAPSPN